MCTCLSALFVHIKSKVLFKQIFLSGTCSCNNCDFRVLTLSRQICNAYFASDNRKRPKRTHGVLERHIRFGSLKAFQYLHGTKVHWTFASASTCICSCNYYESKKHCKHSTLVDKVNKIPGVTSFASACPMVILVDSTRSLSPFSQSPTKQEINHFTMDQDNCLGRKTETFTICIPGLLLCSVK